jgi:hypothetical protein
MDQLSTATSKHFKSLIDLVAVGYLGAYNQSALGPCVGDDGPSAPVPSLTVLGPCVGDDETTSDARLKEDVHRIGTTVFGLPLYQFKYRGKPETYEGVMAQEVLKVMPGAVSVGADGYYRVNYRTLGTCMRRVS